ncbi:MAG: allophanate hydrolase [Rhodobiaceae bacterium]|nr:allophanate hydrolase [Rhodobiaceae bacterium]|tara:strand:- start:953 stop:1897 length:945 start_codon:yes stop_codon:yes gene_type:complete
MSNNYFKVIRSGINSTFQDKGRSNLYHLGIPFSGAMDNRNYLLANKLVKNDLNHPALEFAYQGPLLKYIGEKINIVITGDVSFTIKSKISEINGNCYETYEINDGDEIDILSTNKSVYGYLSFSGKFDVSYQWGSCSTNTKSHIGANNGKKLFDNQIIKISEINKDFTQKKINYFNSKIEKIRVIKGTNFDYFSEIAISNFFKKEFKVSKLSDRMGMRLEGVNLENINNSNIKSEGLIKGVIQVPGDGNPIIMLSDHGTIGGYPKIAVIISADYDRIVQFPSGSKIKFQQVELSDAETLFKMYEMETQNLLNQI